MRRIHFACLALVILFGAVLPATSQFGGELCFVLRSEPKTFNPMLLVDDESSETIRYLTGGVLIRVNRKTQVLEPELAESWKISVGGKKISFRLRDGLSFSDGTAFNADDVAFTMRALMDPSLHSPTGDSFRSSEGPIHVEVSGARDVSIEFPASVAALEFRSSGHRFFALAKERGGRFRAIYCCRLQIRLIRFAETESLLLEEGCAGPKSALSEFDPIGNPAESRSRTVALQARRNSLDQQS